MSPFHKTVFEAIEDFIFSRREEAPTLGQGTPPPVIEVTALEPAHSMTTPFASPPLVPLSENPDVEAILDLEAAKRGGELNWRTSIVDLLTLCGVNPTLENRKALATELDYSGSVGDGETGLHTAVMKELEKRGGRVPVELQE